MQQMILMSVPMSIPRQLPQPELSALDKSSPCARSSSTAPINGPKIMPHAPKSIPDEHTEGATPCAILRTTKMFCSPCGYNVVQHLHNLGARF